LQEKITGRSSDWMPTSFSANFGGFDRLGLSGVKIFFERDNKFILHLTNCLNRGKPRLHCGTMILLSGNTTTNCPDNSSRKIKHSLDRKKHNQQMTDNFFPPDYRFQILIFR